MCMVPLHRRGNWSYTDTDRTHVQKPDEIVSTLTCSRVSGGGVVSNLWWNLVEDLSRRTSGWLAAGSPCSFT